MADRIYLDHAATTPLDEAVLAEMLPHLSSGGHNPSSLHTEGRGARAVLDAARDRVAAIVTVNRKEITFTGSGSEADTQAIVGVARANRKRGAHIISTAVEHHAVLYALRALESEGFEVTLLPVDSTGVVSPAAFEEALRPETVLATVMLANNEIGTLQPVAELARIARARGIIFHTDAVQAAPWLDVSPAALGVDLLSISAHKFYGPKGVGVLYVRDGVAIEPIVHGGGQEFGRRSGTENVPGIVGLAAALERAAQDREGRNRRVAELRDRLEARITGALADARVNGAGAPRLPNISNLAFRGRDSQSMLMALDLEGIAVSSGSACTSGVLEPSHVIAAIGDDPAWQSGVLRFSLGMHTTDDEIDRVADAVIRIVGTHEKERTGT